MAYDPQANRRRPQPDIGDPAPVDAILGSKSAPPTTPTTPAGSDQAPVTDDPPPTPAVTPAPADPPSDKVLFNTGLVSALAAVAALLALRHFWNRRRRRQAPTD